ncbi:MAG: response regulator [Chitinivibrionales bacterium]|nr:response regulator [Chitinivibrionales bacterium]
MGVDSKELLTNALDQVPLGVLATDSDGVVWYANRGAAEMLGRGAAALVGSEIATCLYGEQGERTWHEIRDSLQSTGVCDRRVNLAQSDGGEIHGQLHAVAQQNPSTGESYFLLVVRDIATELHSARHLEEKNIQMARMNAELVRSNAELRRVSELKSNFLSIASHELKTPLTSIKGYSDIIIDTMKESVEAGVYSMVSSINRAADRLHRVVNNILDATRIEKRRLRLSPEEMDFVEVIKEAVDELRQFSIQRSIEFRCSFEENLPRFYGDRMRMQQVCVNLFSNALKYSPDNTSVEVALYLEDEERFHLEVRDHGVGIPPEEQKRIFMPFYELGSVTKHSSDGIKFMGSGAGLGLSIVKGVVERHGGRVWVESEGSYTEEFPGSAFHVVVPVRPAMRWDDAAAAGAKTEEAWARVGEPEKAEEDRVRPVVLVIDPDHEALEVARMALEAEFDVFTAREGGTGLAMAFEHHPSFVLLEREVPVLDGYQVCRLLRSQDETAESAIAFFSSSPTDEQLNDSFASGADDYLIKPLATDELRRRVRKLVEKKKRDLEHPLR